MNEKNYPGRVITHYGNQLEVEILDGPLAGSTQRCHQKGNTSRLVAGDLVTCRPGSTNTGVIISQSDRINVFGRFDNDGKFKPLASNLNCVLVVIAATPKAYINLVDRYLVALRKLELDAFLLLNKVDLIDEALAQELIKEFSKKIHGEIITLSTLEKKSVSKIKSKLISYVA